jgi:hypothetical protein
VLGVGQSPNMALQRTRRPRVPKHGTGFGTDHPGQVLAGTGGSPLNARPLGRAFHRGIAFRKEEFP